MKKFITKVPMLLLLLSNSGDLLAGLAGEDVPPLPVITITASGNYNGEWLQSDPSAFSGVGYSDNYGELSNSTPTTDVTTNKIDFKKCGNQTSNPVIIASGKKIQQEQDFFGNGEMPLDFIRYYDSNTSGNADFAGKWRHSFDYRLRGSNLGAVRMLPDGSNVAVTNGQGYESAEFVGSQWRVYLSDGSVEFYDELGKLIYKANDQGIGWSLDYTNKKLVKVTHTNGKSIQLVWSGEQISKMIDPAGNEYLYSYDSKSRLTKVTYPAGLGSKTYHYGENGAAEQIISGISIDGKRYNTYYFSGDKAIQSGRSDGTQNDKLEYGSNYTLVTNPLGAKSKYIYADNKKDKLVRIERSGVNNCPNSSAQTTYDNKGYVSSTTDWNGVSTEYERNGNAFGIVSQQITGIKGTDRTQAQITKYESQPYRSRILKTSVYDNNINKPVSETNYEYDSFLIKPMAVSYITRLKSVKQCSKTGTTTCSLIGYGYTYYDSGMPKTLSKNINGNNTIYQWDSGGNLLSLTDPLGQVTTYSNYNGLGLVGKITDPNGLVTDLTYDARGRIISKKETLDSGQVRTTTYQQGPFGVTQTESNGIRETINYNDNGTIASITHGNGATVLTGQYFTYSALGKLQGVNYKVSGDIRYAAVNEQNQLGWTTADKGNNSQNVKYDYDGNGNIIKQTDSLGKITTYQYNYNNQLIQETSPAGSITTYSYDTLGNLLTVTDPRSKITTYLRDGFGNVIKQVSPDTGTTLYEYDANNNLTKLTRNNNVVTTYTYDGLNRRTKATTGSSNQTWNYDSCINGKGRLCSTVDGTTTVGYTYTKDGQLASQITTINGVQYPVYWSYDSAGRVIGESRANDTNKVFYEYDALGRVSAVKVKIGSSTTIANVVSGITYEPYGGVKTWNYGNGLGRTTTFDKDYRLTSINSPNLQSLTHAYNANNLFTAITNSLNTAKTTSYTYDSLNQLTKAAATSLTEEWTLDANGNRTQRKGVADSTEISDYVIDASSNRLNQITGAQAKNYSYNNLGNLTRKTGDGGTVAFSYDGFNRLSTVTAEGETYSYNYNAFNQRIRKSETDGFSTNYLYAPDGRLLAETAYSSAQTGALGSVYIWLHGQPIAMVRNNALYFIHNDHLGRPEAITDGNKAIQWQGYNTTYDSSVNFNGFGQFSLGFPGQYYDAESNLWYNWNRYYDATTGRYTQSDPIGLAGGLNTYAYVGNNPVSNVDPLGLWAAVPSLVEGAIEAGVIVNNTKNTVSAVNATMNLATAMGLSALNKNDDCKKTFYHYTDQSGFNSIINSNYTIRANNRGQVYMTLYPMNARTAVNSLFLGGQVGSYANKGDYVIMFNLRNGVPLSPGNQPNELIHYGTIRYGRQIDNIIYSGPNPF